MTESNEPKRSFTRRGLLEAGWVVPSVAVTPRAFAGNNHGNQHTDWGHRDWSQHWDTNTHSDHTLHSDWGTHLDVGHRDAAHMDATTQGQKHVDGGHYDGMESYHKDSDYALEHTDHEWHNDRTEDNPHHSDVHHSDSTRHFDTKHIDYDPYI